MKTAIYCRVSKIDQIGLKQKVETKNKVRMFEQTKKISNQSGIRGK